jgi:hypothetical protein
MLRKLGPLYRRVGELQGRSGLVRKISLSIGIRSPDRPGRRVVAIPTELPRLYNAVRINFKGLWMLQNFHAIFITACRQLMLQRATLLETKENGMFILFVFVNLPHRMYLKSNSIFTNVIPVLSTRPCAS